MDDSGSSERDDSGRFVAGHAKRGGRRPGQTISAELRRQADPEHIASKLLDMIDDPRTGTRERLGAIALVMDRLEGKAIARSVTMSADRLLPAGWDVLPPEQRHAVLADMRRRALRGAVPDALPESTEAYDDGEA